MAATTGMKQLIGFSWIILFTMLTVGSVYANGERINVNDKPNKMARLPGAQPLRLKLTVGDKTVVLPLIDSQTTREFVKLLPLTLDMNDINNREKYCGLPTKLSGVGSVSTTYKIGDLSYWLGGGIAAFYNHDGREVKAGLIVLAKLEKNVDLFNVTGSVKATFELVKD